MSKKMSLADVKEVRRIITNLLSDSVKDFSIIHTYHNRSRIQFSSSITYGACALKAQELVHSNSMTNEILKLQGELFHQSEILRVQVSKPEENGEIFGRSTIPNDYYNVISGIINQTERTLQKNVQDVANTLAQTYNKYMDNIEARTFDAYTKGMSADDFLNIVKDEIAEIKIKADDLKKEVEKNGYSL